MRAIIVPCVREKVWRDPLASRLVAAKDAYIEPRFKLWRHHAEASGDPWFILSTNYGLLRPEDTIQNYERPLAPALRDAALRQELSRQGRALGLLHVEELVLLDYDRFTPLVQAAAPGVPVRLVRLTLPGSAQRSRH